MSGCRFSFYFWEHTHRLPGLPLPHPPVLNGQVETGPSGLPCLNCGNSTECGNGSKQHPWIVTGSLSPERQLRAFISVFYRIATPPRLHPHILSYSVVLSPSSSLSHPIFTFVITSLPHRRCYLHEIITRKKRASKLEAKLLLRSIGGQDHQNQRHPTSSWPRSSP